MGAVHRVALIGTCSCIMTSRVRESWHLGQALCPAAVGCLRPWISPSISSLCKAAFLSLWSTWQNTAIGCPHFSSCFRNWQRPLVAQNQRENKSKNAGEMKTKSGRKGEGGREKERAHENYSFGLNFLYVCRFSNCFQNKNTGM